MRTTVGQLLVNEGLPEEFRDYERRLDRRGIEQLLSRVAESRPDDYAAVLKHLMDVGRSASSTKGLSVSLRHLVGTPERKKMIAELRAANQRIVSDPKLSPKEKDDRLVAQTMGQYDRMAEQVYEAERRRGSPYAFQVESGSRGNRDNLMSLVGADLLVSDSKDRPVPVPIYHSYAEGLTPAEYWATTHGARKGLLGVKLGVAQGGYLSKEIALANHRQVVTDERPKKTRLPVGLPVDADDPDNEGAVLAREAGGYPAGTVLTAKILEDLAKKEERLLICSPMTSLSESGGIDRLSAGIRQGRLSPIGDNVGITAGQAVTEPLAQGLLSLKHRSGSGKTGVSRSGFDYLNRLLQAPEYFQEAGPLAPIDGRVKTVEKAPQGGHWVLLGDQKVYLHPGISPTVKPGQKVEQGDDLSDGVPHPRQLVELLGVGEARRRLLGHLIDGFKQSGIKVRRRNAESVVSGLINHLRVSNPDGMGDSLAGEVLPYQQVVADYQPRPDSRQVGLKEAEGKFLEEPVLHYGPGTRVSSRVARELSDWGVADLQVSDDPPDFEPMYERLLMAASHDPDWQVGLSGFGIKRTFLDAVARGRTSQTGSTSYLPALAQGSDFGRTLEQSGRY